MMIQIILLLVFAASSWAETYWVSASGGTPTCEAASGASDPGGGNYRTRANVGSCTSAGDTVMHKAGTYTGSPVRFDQEVVGGTSTSVVSKVLCEGDRTCIIASNASVSFYRGIVTLRNAAYYQVGADGQGFTFDCVNAGDTCVGFSIEQTTANAPRSNIVVEGNRFINHHANGITMFPYNSTYPITNITIRKNLVEAPATPYGTADGPPHAIYLKARDSVVTQNTVTAHNQNTGGPSFGIHNYRYATGNTITKNIVYTSTLSWGIISTDFGTSLPGNSLIAENVIRSTTGDSAVCIQMGSDSDSSEYHNNVCDGFTTFLSISSGASGNTWKNNVCSGTCGYSGSGSTSQLDCGGTCTTTNPVVTAATHYVNPSGGDYSLKDGSSLKDTGLDVGLPCNPSGNCDKGAYEVPTHAACTVEDGDATTVRVTVNNNDSPPMQITDSTGVTVKVAGSGATVNGVAITGTNRLDITLAAAVTNGQSVSYSYAQTGDFRNSKKVGGTVNQEYWAITDQSCTNNVGAPASHVFTQASFQFRGLRGTEAGTPSLPHAASAADTDIKTFPGGKFRLRFLLTCSTADCPAAGFYPYISRNSAAYTILPDTFDANNIAFCGAGESDVPYNAATTDQLSGGSFYPALVVGTQAAIPTVDLDTSTSANTELEYCIKTDTDTTVTDTFDIRLYDQGGTAINAYTVTPRVTIEAPAAYFGGW